MHTGAETRDGTLALLGSDVAWIEFTFIHNKTGAVATYAFEFGKDYLKIQQCDSSYGHLAIETTCCLLLT